MIKLDLEAINRIHNNGKVGVLLIDNKIYYYGTCGYNDIVGELLSKKILNLIGINCLDYDYAILKNEYVKLSEEIPGFTDGEDLGVPYDNLYDIWDSLEKQGFDAKRLMRDFIKIYLFDILFLNDDRVARNWGISKIDDQVELYAIDNEEIFSRKFIAQVQSEFAKVPYQNRVLTEDETLERNISNLKRFLETSDTEFYELFLSIYNTLTPEVVEDAYNELDSIELKEEDKELYFGDKEENLELYRKNYRLIGELIMERRKSK